MLRAGRDVERRAHERDAAPSVSCGSRAARGRADLDAHGAGPNGCHAGPLAELQLELRLQGGELGVEILPPQLPRLPELGELGGEGRIGQLPRALVNAVERSRREPALLLGSGDLFAQPVNGPGARREPFHAVDERP